jgi:hypothetical protein
VVDRLKATLSAMVRDLPVPGEAKSSRTGRVFAQAALFFLAYAIVQVAINGIVLDETVIAAQIIMGAVRHDAGHPHAIYYTQAFSLPHYLSALAWWIFPSVEGISAVRDVLVFFVTMFATFTLTYVLTGRPLWAWIAAAVLIAEANLRFAGLYPMSTFPAIYSNGNFGLHYSILIVALLLAGMYRSSALLLGLLPAIHAMFAVIVWPWALLLLIGRRVYRDRTLLLRILLWGGFGIAVCAGLWVVIHFTADHRPPVPPYDVTANGSLIRQQFRIWTDGHRRPIPARSMPYFGNAVAFFVLGVLLLFRAKSKASSEEAAATDGREHAEDGTARDRARTHSKRAGIAAQPDTDTGPSPWQIRSILVLGGLVWAYVFGAWLWMRIAGTLPDWLFLTMPSRFSNVSAALLPAMTGAALAGSVGALDERRRKVALVTIGVLLLLAALADANLVRPDTRMFLLRNCIFIFWGVLLGCEWMTSSGRHRNVVVACLAVLVAVLLTYLSNTKVGLYLLASAIGTVALLGIAPRLMRGLQRTPGEPVLQRRLLMPAIVLLFVAALPGRVLDPRENGSVRWDMQSPDTRSLSAWFRQNARRDEPVLTIFIPNSELQLKTGQPLLFEQKTLWIMSYIPSLAPVIGTMAKDLYGVDYEDPEWLAHACDGGRVSIYCLVWNEAWEKRSPEEWQALSRKYRFRFVLSATRVPLKIPVAVPGEQWTLYEIGKISDNVKPQAQ